MKHNIRINGIAFRLRPVTNDDAEFIVDIRNNPKKNTFIQDGAKTVKEQLDWLKKYSERDNDYYFVVEDNKAFKHGLISIYDVGPVDAEWGRWLIRDGSLASVESVMLIYRVAFESLNLQSVYCKTVADNKAVISFHNSCGCRMVRRYPNEVSINGLSYDTIEHRVSRQEWDKIRSRLSRIADSIHHRS